MIRKLAYNNRILTAEEREEYCRIADGYINEYSKYVEDVFQLLQKVSISKNVKFIEIFKTILDVSTFMTYACCDCIVLNKLFVQATNPYEKSFLRGKLKVQLNESFKKLYGFKNGYRDSYCAKLEKIIAKSFPEYKRPFDDLLSDLAQISKASWWKEERDAEVHVDVAKLYELRHEEINESKVVMEAGQLTSLFRRINRFIADLVRVYYNDVTIRFVKEFGHLPTWNEK